MCHEKKRQEKSTAKVNLFNNWSQKEDLEYGFIGAVNSEVKDDGPYHTLINLNGEQIKFKIDCGADVTVLPSDTFPEKQ